MIFDFQNARMIGEFVYSLINRICDSFCCIFVTRAFFYTKGTVTETKDSFMVSATSSSLEMIVSSSIKTILFLDCSLSEKRGFTVFQNFLLSVTSEMSRLFIIISFFPSK